MIGQILGNYKIEQKLGEGGMGSVYRGVDLMLEREVAIKALRPELGSNPQVVERFRSEAVTLAKLIHQNIVTLYSFMRQGNDFFMVLEYVRGETLDSIIQRTGAMPAAQAIPMFCRMLDGIEYAHSFGIVHRDIKPANMILSETGALKVLDFGIARILGTARLTRAGNVIGTIEYMSPEQVRGHETDARSDIYSLGMMLYEMLTGRVPFESQNEFELMSAQVNQTPVLPRALNPAIPPEVEQAIMRAISKNPDERFQSAAEFRAVLLSAGFASADATTGSHAAYPASRPSNPQLNVPTSPSKPPLGAVTTPMIPAPPPEEESLKETRIMTSAEVAAPAPGASKETRLATPAGAQHGAAAGQPKETRLSTPAGGAAAHAQPFAPPPPSTPPQASFLSKLTPIHFIGAGVAALVLIGLLVGVPLAYVFLGGEKEPPPAAEQKTVPPPQPEVTREPEPPPVVTAPPVASDAQTSPAPADATAVPAEKPLDLGTVQTGGAAETPVQSKPAVRPAAKPSSKPKGDADAARRRREALRALDQ